MPKSGDDPNISKSAQSLSVTTSVVTNGVSATSTAAVTNAAANKKSSKKKSKSSDTKAGHKIKSKSKPKSREKAVSSGSGTKQGKSKKKTKSKKKKSADGGKSKKKKESTERKSKKKKSAESKKKSSKKGRKSSSGSKSRPGTAVSLTAHEQKKICHKVRKIEASKGAVAVNSEKAIESVGYIVDDVAPFYTSDYSSVRSAKSKKDAAAQFVVKVITLAECSPRARVNLLQNSVRIMRFVGGGADSESGHHRKGQSLSPLFPKIADIFLVGTVKLFVFMQYVPGRSVYDWVKTQRKQNGEEQANSESVQSTIRKWFKAMIKGVHELQRIGVAHRAVKLQHILLDEKNNPKLIGWSKSVFFYEPSKRSILLQKKERRVRSNLHLPPESFSGNYNPAPADVWSLGVALVAMSTCSYPFNVRDKKTKFGTQWRRFIKSHMMNSFARNLCHRIFVIDPKGRISTKDILKDKYFEAPAKKLTEISCKLEKAALIAVKEDSRLGGMSAIENVQEVQKSQVTKVENAPLAAPPAAPPAAPMGAPAEEKPPPLPEEGQVAGGAEEAEAEGAEGEDAAGGYEGGVVGGEEENLPPAEAEEEAHLSQMNAPEEAEAEALPEEGEEKVEEAAAEEAEEEAGGGEDANEGAEE